MKPQWTHDCDRCTYLGSVDHTKGRADWYTCTDSVVARFGSEGADYWSMPKDMVNNDRYLTGEMTVVARLMLLRGY
jgi:hypothetical protein